MSDDMRPYEPWTPSVGQRVRVRLSPECREVFEERNRLDVVTRVMAGSHFPETDGAVGQVERILRTSNAHHYVVRFDRDVFVSENGRMGWSWGGCLAAAELEPLDGDQ